MIAQKRQKIFDVYARVRKVLVKVGKICIIRTLAFIELSLIFSYKEEILQRKMERVGSLYMVIPLKMRIISTNMISPMSLQWPIAGKKTQTDLNFILQQ